MIGTDEERESGKSLLPTWLDDDDDDDDEVNIVLWKYIPKIKEKIFFNLNERHLINLLILTFCLFSGQ